MNAKQLAEQAGISLRHAYCILNGQSRPSRKTALKLENATGVPAEAWIYPERHDNPHVRVKGEGDGANAEGEVADNAA